MTDERHSSEADGLDPEKLFPDDGHTAETQRTHAPASLDAPVENWGQQGLPAAVATLHSRRIASAIRQDKHGQVADTIETSTMWDSTRFGGGVPKVPGQFHVIEALMDYIQLARGSSVVQELTPCLRGVWLIHTQGSRHLWNLDDMTYERRPGSSSRSRRCAYDEQATDRACGRLAESPVLLPRLVRRPA